MPASEFSDVFVSYRRKDVDFVKQLVADLQAEGKEVWVDWEDIPPGVEGFADEIKRGLEGADTFIAVLSPDYLDSTYCVDLELAYAVELQKRIIPIVVRTFDDHEVPKDISHINWIYFIPHAGQPNTYEDAFPKILEVMHTDLEHVKQHKRFLLRAIEWNQGDRHPSFLLNGEEIDNAQVWLSRAAGKEPIPTELHQEYITTSVKHRQRQQRLLFSGIVVALVVSVILSILSFVGFNDASIAQQTAVANLNVASTAKAEAETNENIASTSRANAETSANLAQTAQAEAEENEVTAVAAQAQAEQNLRDARQSQALFHGDLAQQQASLGLYQRALLLGLEALKFHAQNITSDSAYQAIHDVLHQPIKQILHLDYPRGIRRTLSHDTLPQMMVITDAFDFRNCPTDVDCSSRVEIWDIVEQEQIAYLPHDLPILNVLWFQDDEQAMTLAYDRNTNQANIRLWSLTDSSEIYHLPYEKSVLWIWETNGEYFITVEQDVPFCATGNPADCNRMINIYTVADGELIMSIPTGRTVSDVYVTEDEQYLTLQTSQGNGRLTQLYDLNTGDLLQEFDSDDRLNVLEWRDNDTRIIGEQNGEVISQSLETGDTLYAISATTPYYVDVDLIVFDVPDTYKDCDPCNEFDVYSSITGELLFSTLHERNEVNYVGTVQDGKYMLTRTVDNFSCVDCEVGYFVWDVETGTLLNTLVYEGWIENGSGGHDISPDESQILIYSLNSVEHFIIETWDIATGDTGIYIDMDREIVFDVQYDDSGQHIIVDYGDFVSLYDVGTGFHQHILGHIQSVEGITILRDHLLITTQTQTSLKVWDVVDWAVTLRNPGTIDIVGETYNRKRTQLVTWSGMEGFPSSSNNAYVWDTESGRLLFTLETPAPVYNALWSPDEKFIVVTQQGGTCDACFDGVRVFNANTGEHITDYDSVSGSGRLSWIDATTNLISDQSDDLIVLNVNSGEVVFSSGVHSEGLSEWNSDYSLVVDQNPTDYTAIILSYPSGDMPYSIPLESAYYDADWLDDDRLLLFFMDSPTERATDLVAYEVETGTEQYRIENVGIFEESPSGDNLLVYTEDQELHLVAADTGEIVWTSPTLNQEWTDILWSPDESQAILTGFLAVQSQLFEVATGDVLTTLNFSQYQWSPDSRKILAYDDNIDPAVYRVYDVDADLMRVAFTTNERVQLFNLEALPVWTPNSREIVSHDGVWTTEFGELINRGEDLRVRDLTELELQEFFIKPPPDRPDTIEDEEEDDDDDDD